MSANAYFKCYPSDFLNGVIGLTAQEIGVYAVIMMQQYDRRAGVPANLRALAARCSMRPTSVAQVVERLIEAGKVVLQGGLWSNPRASREIEFLHSSATVSQQNGKGGGRKPKQKANEINGDQNPAGTHQGPDTRSQKPEAPDGAARAGATRTRETEPSPDLAKRFEQRVQEAFPAIQAAYARSPGLWDLTAVHRWLSAGCELETDILPPVLGWFAKAGATKPPPRSWAFFEGMVTDARSARLRSPLAAIQAPPPPATRLTADGRIRPNARGETMLLIERCGTRSQHLPDDPVIEDYLVGQVARYFRTKAWNREQHGPAPDEAGTVIPAAIVEAGRVGAYAPPTRHPTRDWLPSSAPDKASRH